MGDISTGADLSEDLLQVFIIALADSNANFHTRRNMEIPRSAIQLLPTPFRRTFWSQKHLDLMPGGKTRSLWVVHIWDCNMQQSSPSNNKKRPLARPLIHFI